MILCTHKCNWGSLKNSQDLRGIVIWKDESWHGREGDRRLSGILKEVLDFDGILVVNVDVAVLENQVAVIFDVTEDVRLLVSKVFLKLKIH